ncbi:MAG: hypothetical protein JWQ38_3077 [Flavipsychrobacter sp.]|nr:hypothetical protein [Flavipsychrobacter sp.]
MKFRYILTVFLSAFLFVQCGTRDKITYNIPSDYPKERKKELLAALDKGKALYKTNCTECHGIFTKGKDQVPNFTNTQIDNYSTRFIMRDRKNHAAAIKMSPEQLNQVLVFLRYKSTKIKDTTATQAVRL